MVVVEWWRGGCGIFYSDQTDDLIAVISKFSPVRNYQLPTYDLGIMLTYGGYMPYLPSIELKNIKLGDQITSPAIGLLTSAGGEAMSKAVQP